MLIYQHASFQLICCIIFFFLCQEFDRFLEEHKQELAEKTLEEGDSSKLQEHEYEIEQADHQVTWRIVFWHFVWLAHCVFEALYRQRAAVLTAVLLLASANDDAGTLQPQHRRDEHGAGAAASAPHHDAGAAAAA